MVTFWMCLQKERKAIFKVWLIPVAALIIFLSLFFLNRDINRYYKALEQKDDFRKVQDIRALNIHNYLTYSFLGVKIISIPSPMSTFFDSTIQTLPPEGKIDSTTLLEICGNTKGSGLFKGGDIFSFRLSSLIYILGSAFAMLLGFGIRLDYDWFRFLISHASRFKVFIYICTAKFIIIIAFIAILIFPSLGLMGLRGMLINSSDLLKIALFFGFSSLFMLIFLALGIIVAACWDIFKAFSLGFFVWVGILFILPFINQTIIVNNSDYIFSSYTLQLKQLEIMMAFEKNAKGQIGSVNKSNLDIAREYAEHFWKKDRLQIELIEKEYLNQLKQVAHHHQSLALWFPTTFYQSVSNEISGLGYENYLSFYQYAIKLKSDFLRFWIDKVYYEKAKKVESFVKGDEDVFYSRSALPRNFGVGIAVAFLYALLFLALAWFRFVGAVYFPAKRKFSYSRVRMLLETRDRLIFMSDPADAHHLGAVLNVFLGKRKGFDGSILVDDRDLLKAPREPLLYMPSPAMFPDGARVKDLAGVLAELFRLKRADRQKMRESAGAGVLNRPLSSLTALEKALLTVKLCMWAPYRVWIFHNFSNGLNENERFELDRAFDAIQRKDMVLILADDGGRKVFTCRASGWHTFLTQQGEAVHFSGQNTLN